jgi:hypothetical protein
MCPTPARRVTLLTCICRNSAAALAVTGLSEGCGAFFCTSGSVFIEVPIDRKCKRAIGPKQAAPRSIAISTERESSDRVSYCFATRRPPPKRNSGAPAQRSECLGFVRPFFRLAEGTFFLYPQRISLTKKILIVGICPMSFRKSVMRTAHNASTLLLSRFSVGCQRN